MLSSVFTAWDPVVTILYAGTGTRGTGTCTVHAHVYTIHAIPGGVNVKSQVFATCKKNQYPQVFFIKMLQIKIYNLRYSLKTLVLFAPLHVPLRRPRRPPLITLSFISFSSTPTHWFFTACTLNPRRCVIFAVPFCRPFVGTNRCQTHPEN